MLPPGPLFFLLSHQNLPADTDPPAKGGQTSPHTAPKSAVLPLPPRSPRNTFIMYRVEVLYPGQEVGFSCLGCWADVC